MPAETYNYFMEIILLIIIVIIIGVAGFLLERTNKAKKETEEDYRSLLAAIQSPICIVNANGKLLNIINRKYVRESMFILDKDDDYNIISMLDNVDDERVLLMDLHAVINEKSANYVNRNFVIKDEHGTMYHVLIHIIYYKPGRAYVFFNRLRIPKDKL